MTNINYEIPEHQYFVVSVDASTSFSPSALPLVPGWVQTMHREDAEIKVRYARYVKIVEQPVSGEGPDVDHLADIASEVDKHLEAIIEDNISYEKRVYLVSHPIAAWN